MSASIPVERRVLPHISRRVIYPERETMLSPKWFVIGAALAAFLLLITYDLMFGIAAGVLLAVIAAIRIGFAIWLAPEQGAPESERGALVERFRRLSRNRRKARIKELDAKDNSVG